MQQDLIDKYYSDLAFKQQINVKRNEAIQLRKKTTKRDLSLIPQTIMTKYPTIDQEIYFYFGYQQPVPKKYLPNIVMFLLKYFNPQKNKPFSLVFFNDLCQDNYILWNFRQTLTYLPIQQLACLKQFIVVKPYFYHKAMDFMTFGTLEKFIRARSIFIGNNAQLCQYFKITPQHLAQNVPSCLFEKEFPEFKGKDVSLPRLRQNISAQERNQEDQVQFQQFQKTIKSMVMKPGAQINILEDYEISDIGVPLVLKMLVYYFQAYPEGKLLEGLFRKSVSIDDQNDTIKKIMERNYDYLLEVENPHIIANLIKRFFSSLKIPIFPFAQFKMLMDDKKVTDKLQHLMQVVKKLPQLNYLTLMFLINFLCQQIIPNEPKNKMTEQNLAICFSPCFLRSEVPSPADLIYAGKSVTYVKMLMLEKQKIFGTLQEQQEKYRQSYYGQKKDFENVISMICDQQNQVAENLLQSQPVNMSKTNRYSRQVENFDEIDFSKFQEEQKAQQMEEVKEEHVEKQQKTQEKQIHETKQVKEQVKQEPNQPEQLIKGEPNQTEQLIKGEPKQLIKEEDNKQHEQDLKE